MMAWQIQGEGLHDANSSPFTSVHNLVLRIEAEVFSPAFKSEREPP